VEEVLFGRILLFLMFKETGWIKVQEEKKCLLVGHTENVPILLPGISHNHYMNLHPQRVLPNRLAKDNTGYTMVFLSYLMQMSG
jgi:hypothetical protein